MFGFITTKFLGYVSGALGVALVVTGGLLYLQTERLDIAKKEHAVFVKGVEQARDVLKQQDSAREAAHQNLLKGKDDERKKAIASTNAGWRAYIAGLPKPTGGTGNNAQSVQITAGGLNDAADSARVSAAVSEFRDEVRAAVREFRDEVAGQLEQAQLQTDALIRAQAWAAEEQRINSSASE